MTIKAIETKYQGYRFRSRLEARYAVFFDALGLEWEYEKEGFDLGDAGWYLPDFWLPGLGVWVEIKPDEPSEEEAQKAAALMKQSEQNVFMLIGVPDNCFGLGPTFRCCSTCGAICVIEVASRPNEAGEMRIQWRGLSGFCFHPEGIQKYDPVIDSAVEAARSARFENR